jgi:type I restriction enzyme S subunit
MTHETVPLGDLIKAAPTVRAGSRETLPILSMTMHHGLVDQAEKFKKRIASADISPYKVVERGQLVVGFPIDEAVLAFQSKYDSAIVSPAYAVWSLADREIDREFLELFLRSPQAIEYYKSRLRGSTARRRSLPVTTFLELPVPLPLMAEQRRIVAILDQADELRTKRRRALTFLDELADSLFIKVFGDPANRQNWGGVGKVRDVLESAKYGTSAKAGDSGEFPVLRMGNITTAGRVDMTNLKYMDMSAEDKNKYLVFSGDVLFNRTNSADLVGKTALYREESPVAFAGYLVRLRPNASNTGEYISSFLNTNYAKTVLRGMAKSIVGMANINAQEVQRIEIPLVPKGLQDEFVITKHKLEAHRHRMLEEVVVMDDLFSSLQHRAFRGEL